MQRTFETARPWTFGARRWRAEQAERRVQRAARPTPGWPLLGCFDGNFARGPLAELKKNIFFLKKDVKNNKKDVATLNEGLDQKFSKVSALLGVLWKDPVKETLLGN
jgi:hypothetical protein